MSRDTRKRRIGRVISTKMENTIVVAVRWEQRNRLYGKAERRITKFYVDDSQNSCSLGDLVRIEETRHISRQKNWRLLEILEKREVPEVSPIELDQKLLDDQARKQTPNTNGTEQLEATEVPTDETIDNEESED